MLMRERYQRNDSRVMAEGGVQRQLQITDY
jgi:hypothetical protein